MGDVVAAFAAVAVAVAVAVLVVVVVVAVAVGADAVAAAPSFAAAGFALASGVDVLVEQGWGNSAAEHGLVAECVAGLEQPRADSLTVCSDHSCPRNHCLQSGLEDS